ncbi:MAG: radical SAM family heme chaperone HemW [Bacteroidales bacterium]
MNRRVGGIYIHIPFCRQACRYCDFYFTISTQYQDLFTKSLLKEFEIRASGMQEYRMETLYLGGGTPSLLTKSNLQKILRGVMESFRFSEEPEITIECNPDDLDASQLSNIRGLGFNRISIGIQSFREEDLILMRRSHNALQAVRAVHEAASAGFDNITIDLIFGIPGQTPEGWRANLLRALELPVNHISAYHLTFETGTVFDHWRRKGKIAPVAEDESVEMYRILREELTGAGFEHYEISNFAKERFRSRHNQIYWSGEPYMGFGPSAHSYNGTSRYWNASSLKNYIKSLQEGEAVGEREELTNKEKYHDYLITSLRTCEGADPQIIRDRFGEEVLNHFLERSGRFLMDGLMVQKKERIAIDPESWLLADLILRELFLR